MDDAIRFEKLRDALKEASSGTRTLTVAYSGGLDSRFLSFCAKREGYAVRLLHVTGPHISAQETQEAVDLARAMGLEAELVRVKLADARELARAGRARCYICKKTIFTQLQAMAEGARLCDGTNASDLKVFRPGSRAIAELGVFSPLASAGFEKADIYRLAAKLGLPYPSQAARPCLLTRFPYGVEPAPEMLAAVGEVEKWLSENPLAAGVKFRLRYPDGQHPVLHLAREGLGEGPRQKAEAIARAVREHFGGALSSLPVEVFEHLSGYYDRPEAAGGGKTS